MKTKLFLVAALLFVAANFSFVEKEKTVEERKFYPTEYVRYDGWGSCGLVFRNLNTGEQIWVVSQPEEMYLRIGSTFYISRVAWPYVNPNCTQWQITEFQQVSNPYY
ncbi:hypothetical protein AB9P05_02855 [Roseivirga sp. BDSF3-8]|uniref:hypothetical protein n=1 Tax=Roseivirga sp. BDSF3-8 TaxID=3241598 RepID=UPI003531AC9B